MMEELKTIKLEDIEYIPRELYDTAIVAIDQLTDTVNNLEEHRKMIEAYSRCNESQSIWHTPDEVPEKGKSKTYSNLFRAVWKNKTQYCVYYNYKRKSWFYKDLEIMIEDYEFIYTNLPEPSEDDWKNLKEKKE